MRQNFIKITFYDSVYKPYEFLFTYHSPHKILISDATVHSFCTQHNISQIKKLEITSTTNDVSFIIENYTLTNSIYFSGSLNGHSLIPAIKANHTDVFLNNLTIHHILANCSSININSCQITHLEAGKEFSERSSSQPPSAIDILSMNRSFIKKISVHTPCHWISIKKCHIHEIHEKVPFHPSISFSIGHFQASEYSEIDTVYMQKSAQKITLENATVKNTCFQMAPQLHEYNKNALHKYLDTTKINPKFFSILEYIDEHYQEPLDLVTLSSVFHLNKSYIGQLFQKNLNTSFPKYLNFRRILNAQILLSAYDIPIQDVAELTGYQDYYYFIKVFKKITGETPASYRKRHKNVVFSPNQLKSHYH